MTTMYGPKWTSANGDMPELTDPRSRLWLSILRPMSNKMVRIGLTACRRQGMEWPPDPHVFEKMVSDNYRPEHQTLPRSRRLAHLASARETAKGHIDRIRAMLDADS